MHGVSRYQNVAQQTASPQRLMVMLFQRTRVHLSAAAQALESGRLQEARVPIQKAEDIVHELMRTLNHDMAPDLCRDLESVYTFVLTRLMTAVLRSDAKAVREAERAFAPIAEAFEQAVEQQQNAAPPGPKTP